MNPEFLRVDEVLEIHRDQIERYGGEEGLRDGGLLLSAIAVPESTFDGAYLHADLFAMAAAYLFHIVANHPFVDGNKRTGLMCALVFLELNGIAVEVDEDELANLVLAVARGEVEKPAIAEVLRDHAASA